MRAAENPAENPGKPGRENPGGNPGRENPGQYPQTPILFESNCSPLRADPPSAAGLAAIADAKNLDGLALLVEVNASREFHRSSGRQPDGGEHEPPGQSRPFVFFSRSERVALTLMGT